jgi:Transposase and inactivated derivatives
MKDLLEICCGLDVHKDVVVACLLKGELGSEPQGEIIEFSTLLSGLDSLKTWLVNNNCRDIAMESTGVYWFQIYNVLESMFAEDGGVKITVTNPRHMKNVPGKKTDVNDARWIAGLLRAGLLAPSYIPPRDIRELRDWTRYRKTLVQEMTGHKNRIEKFLQQCGFKLSTFLSDIFGLTGMTIIKRLCEVGFVAAADVDSMVFSTARKKISELRQALNGKLNAHEREFLSMLVRTYEHSLTEIEAVEAKIMECAQKYEAAVSLIESIPGIQRTTAVTIVSELGTDLSMFPTAGHLCSWVGMCPGNNESAGKKKSTRITQGNAHLKSVLCQCAWGATRSKKNYLREWFYKLSKRRGMKKAVIALGRKLLVIIYNMLTTGECYDEKHFGDAQIKYKDIRKKRLIAEAKRLGLELMSASA